MVLCYCALAFASGGGGAYQVLAAAAAERLGTCRARRRGPKRSMRCTGARAKRSERLGTASMSRCAAKIRRRLGLTKRAAVEMGRHKHGSPCPPLGVGDLRGSPSNAKAAIPQNRAAIARRAGPRVSHDSPYPSINPRDVHSPPSTAATSNAESRAPHPNSRPPRRPTTALGSPRDPSHEGRDPSRRLRRRNQEKPSR